MQTAHSNADDTGAELEEERVNCNKDVWHMKKENIETFWEVRDDTSIYTETCPGARAENKGRKGEETTRVREESGG